MTEPAWLTHLADQRLALLTEHIQPDLTSDAGVIMTPLTEPEPDSDLARKLWDRTCDGCRKICIGTSFYTGHVQRRLHDLVVIMTYGVCSTCAKTIEPDEDPDE